MIRWHSGRWLGHDWCVLAAVHERRLSLKTPFSAFFSLMRIICYPQPITSISPKWTPRGSCPSFTSFTYALCWTWCATAGLLLCLHLACWAMLQTVARLIRNTDFLRAHASLNKTSIKYFTLEVIYLYFKVVNSGTIKIRGDSAGMMRIY